MGSHHLDLRILEIGTRDSLRFCGRFLADLGATVTLHHRRATPRSGLGKDRDLFDAWLDEGKAHLDGNLETGPGEDLPFDAVIVDEESRDSPVLHALVNKIPIVHISPFGLSGQYSARLGGDLIVSHASGYAYHANRFGPEAAPSRGPEGQATIFSGLVAAVGVLSSTYDLRVSGRARELDLAETDANATLLFHELLAVDRHDPSSATTPRHSSAGGLVGLLPASDGLVIISPREEHQWQKFLAVMGHPAWASRAEFATPAQRMELWPSLQLLIKEWSSRHTKQELFVLLQGNQISCFPLNTVAEAIDLPVPKERGFWREIDTPKGPRKMPGLPFLSTDGGAHASNQASSRGAGPASHSASADPGEAGPLAGIRVVDFSWVVAGPICTRYLSLLGAEVIRVESSVRGEYRRRKPATDLLNVSKKSICVNLKVPEGHALVRRLIAGSDVVVENFGNQVMERLGLSHAELSREHPDLIMLSISALGRKGGGADVAAYGSGLQGYAGWMTEMGLVPDWSSLGEAPPGIRPPWTDQFSGAVGAAAILAFLLEGRRTGKGGHIDLSMLEALLLSEAVAIAAAQPSEDGGTKSVALVNSSRRASPHGCYPCAGEDEWVAIACYQDAEWDRLWTALGCPAWGNGMGRLEERLAHRTIIDQQIGLWTMKRTPEEVVNLLAARGVPVTRTNSIDTLLTDAHFVARRTFPRFADGSRAVGTPWIDRVSDRGLLRASPAVGENTNEVLASLVGMSPDAIAELARSGALV